MLNKPLRMNSPIPQGILGRRGDSRHKLDRIQECMDDENFSDFYCNFAGRIYQYIYYRMMDEKKAEDLTSQVFLKAWENKDHYQRTGAPYIAWLYRIAHNVIIDDFRTRKPIITLEDNLFLESDQPSPVEQCELHMEGELLRNAMQRLTTDQFQVVTLRYMDGLTTDEIAAQLGKRSGSIRALQMRALQSLSKQLEQSQ